MNEHVLTVAARSRVLYPILGWEPKTDFQWRFVRSKARDRWAIGPNGVGKTPLIVEEMIRLLTGIAPPSIADEDLLWLPPRANYRGIILASTKDQMNHGSVRRFREYMPSSWYEWDQTHLWAKIKDPRTGGHRADLFFVSGESKHLSIEGDEYDVGGVDEEPEDDEHIRAIYVQVGKRRGLIIGAVTPIMSARKGLDTWLVNEVVQPALDGKHDPGDTEVVFAKYGDQLTEGGERQTEEELRRMASSMKPWEVRVRLHGELAAANASPFFPPEKIVEMERIASAAPPPRTGDFVRGYELVTFSERADGACRLHYEPVPGRTYIVGADVAAGVEAGDFSAAVVLERETGRVSCVLQARIEPPRFATALERIARYYGNAWIVPEANNWGLAVIERLRNKYHRLFQQREDPNDLEAKYKDFGVTTGPRNRSLLLSRVVEWVLTSELKVRDRPLLREMALMIWDEVRDRPDHPRGGHDDMVFALAMAIEGHTKIPRVESDVRRPGDPEPLVPNKEDAWVGALEIHEREAMEAARNGLEEPDWDPAKYVRRWREGRRLFTEADRVVGSA